MDRSFVPGCRRGGRVSPRDHPGLARPDLKRLLRSYQAQGGAWHFTEIRIVLPRTATFVCFVSSVGTCVPSVPASSSVAPGRCDGLHAPSPPYRHRAWLWLSSASVPIRLRPSLGLRCAIAIRPSAIISKKPKAIRPGALHGLSGTHKRGIPVMTVSDELARRLKLWEQLSTGDIGNDPSALRSALV